jgi:hypothetical protein
VTALVNTFPEDTGSVVSPGKFEDTSTDYASPGELPTGSALLDFVDNAKKTVMDMVDHITNFFQDMFHNSAETEAGASSSTKKSPSFTEMAAGGSFMALAMAVILVVLFKRA